MALLVLPALLSGCTAVEDESPSKTPVSSEGPNGKDGSSSKVRSGEFRLAWGPATNPTSKQWQDVLFESEVLKALVSGLNEHLVLNHDVTVKPVECGVANAFYKPATREVLLCYEMLEHLHQLFLADEEDEDVAAQGTMSTFGFLFFHEIGHALIHVNDLPSTGREEDAVDQLSTLILLGDASEEGTTMAFAAAAWFALEAEQNPADAALFADEHGLNEQRFFNIVCWVYGSNPDEYGALVTEGYLPKDRAKMCPQEYERMESSWSRILEDYVKA